MLIINVLLISYLLSLTSYLLSKIELVARSKFAHFLIIHYLCPTISKFAN